MSDTIAQMLDKINYEEQEFIKDYISNYSMVDEYKSVINTDSIRLDYFLKDWAEEKSDYLIKLFDGQLVLSKEIDVVNTDSNYLYTKARSNIKIANFVWRENNFSSIAKNFLRVLKEAPDPNASNDEWTYKVADSIFNFQNMGENKYTGEDFVIIDPITRAEIKIQKGVKMTRLIAKLKNVFEISDEDVTAVQNAISEVRNTARITGTLCLSIHPIDFMTMSDSSYDWSSCMSWKRTGCYRAGTVATMNAPCTIVAYVLGKNEVFDDRAFAKKWRSLYIVDDSVICSVKGYPYANPQIDEIVVKWLCQLYNDNIKQDAFDLTRVKRVMGAEGSLALVSYPELENKDTGFFEFEAGVMYNDFCGRLENTGVISRQAYEDFKKSENRRCITIEYGKEHTHCAVCGAVVYDMEDCDCDDSRPKLLCDDCEPVRRCHECGRIIYSDGCFDEEGYLYCEECYNDMYEYDVIAQEDDWRENLTEFNITFSKLTSSNYYGMTNLSRWNQDWLTEEGHDRLKEQDTCYEVQLNWEEDFTTEGKQIIWDTMGAYWRRMLDNAGYISPYEIERTVEIGEIKDAKLYVSSTSEPETVTYAEWTPSDLTIDLSQQAQTIALDTSGLTWAPTSGLTWAPNVITDNFFTNAADTIISNAFRF